MTLYRKNQTEHKLLQVHEIGECEDCGTMLTWEDLTTNQAYRFKMPDYDHTGVEHQLCLECYTRRYADPTEV